MGANFQDLAKPGMPVGSSVDMSGAEDMADEDDCDDEGNSGEDTDKGDVQGAKRGSSKSGAIKSTVSRTKRPEAPYKRFRNSFIFFANERRKQWRRAHPEVTKIQNRGFIQEMSKVWNQMSAEEKAPYMRMAEVDKLRYEADVKKYGPLPTNTPPTSSSAGTSANTPPTTSAAANAAKSGEAGSAILQVSVPSVVPIAPAPALTVATIPTAAQPGSAIDASCGSVPLSANGAQAGSDHKVAAAAAAAVAAALIQTSPIAPAFIGHSSYPLPTEASGANPGLLNQQSYHMMLQQAFGQGASPQTVDFDQSCFVGPEAQSADVSAVGFNPFSGSPPIAADGAQQQHPALSGSRRGSVISASVPDALSNSNNNDRGADTPGSGNRGTSVNGPTITTLVGTKRKSSSDGQPLTSLPVSVKRFRNSFIYFVNARRQELQFSRNGSPTNIEVNNREFLKDMSTMWRAMSEDEKAPYLKLAEVDKERFAREMRKYELEHPDEFQKQSRHRRRRSSTTSNGISAGPTGLDAVGPEPSKLQSAATAVATMPFMQPSTAAYSLNLSLSGSGSVSPSGILPFSQSVVNGSAYSLSSMPAEAIVQELNRAVATSVTTPISTAVNTPLTTPLLSPNVPLPSSDKQPEIVQLSLGHVPSLPSVPEEVVVCTDAANTTPVISSVGVAGSTAGFLATAPKVATLPTVLEGADEDVNI
ncbi:hypothetical protein EV175_004415 [Coemansia sp. RSA 1933]|nr:hypothetical protein EV175_004415 [Coemansia sp. RSA 1933]